MSRAKRISVKLIEKGDNYIILLFKNVPVEVMNSIRRITIVEVPTLAIDKVFIFRNDSVINDEMLAHRLGLIPLKTPINKYKFQGEEGDKPDYVSLSLTVEAKKGFVTVYSGDIESSDKEVYPISKEIEIVKLAPGEGVDIEMWAVLGRGKDHAKWSPVSVSVVRGLPVIKVLKDCSSEDDCERCISACPKEILKIEDGKLVVTNLYECTVCKLCEKECPDYIRVDIDEKSSLLYLESIGQIEIKDILLFAFDILLDRVNEFIKSLEEVELNVG